jgi:hypothetical protein
MGRPNNHMEPTRLTVSAIKSPWRAAHLAALDGRLNSREAIRVGVQSQETS